MGKSPSNSPQNLLCHGFWQYFEAHLLSVRHSRSVRVPLLTAARSRSRSDTTPWCHSLRSRRFATPSTLPRKLELNSVFMRGTFERSPKLRSAVSKACSWQASLQPQAPFKILLHVGCWRDFKLHLLSCGHSRGPWAPLLASARSRSAALCCFACGWQPLASLREGGGPR